MPLLSWSFCSTSSSPIISVNTPSYSDNPSLRSIPSYQTDLIRDPNNEELKSLQDQINLLSKKLVFAEQTLYEWKTEFYDLQNRFQDTLNEHSTTIEELKHTRRMLQESEHVRSRWFMKNPSSIALNHQPKEELDTEDHKSVNKASLRSLSKIKVLRFFKAQA
ncbi:hypothetical protein INT46_009363 [Mucor plumbeus]|uniref:Uncharacterized protein n=1 Tax=Mucor plumbeus TaxID=97098 RepID=A0A8H7UQX3_9FUNG|nr:hypothetical protein INT46_009363 [Mucor plumbeus]